MKRPHFSQERLHHILCSHAPCHDYVVAYSGGMDSHVLLHSMVMLSRAKGFNVSAVHVHHGLHPYADDWSEHCMRTCQALSVDCSVLRISVIPGHGDSPESAARDARYIAFRKSIRQGQVIVMAHHQEDQAETFLLQLMRGSGMVGLSGMPLLRPLGRGWLMRPLLEVSRRELLHYASIHELKWIQDPSNVDVRYSRNYIRHKLLPVLRARWPSVAESISRSTMHAAEAVELTDMLARQDLEVIFDKKNTALQLDQFTAVPFIRRKNLMRYWIRERCGTVPPAARLEQLVHNLCSSGRDANPTMRWSGIDIRRYRNHIYILPALPPIPDNAELAWDPSYPLKLPLGKLIAHKINSEVAFQVRPDTLITVRFRCGGEKICPIRRGRTHTVKSLFQESGVPPWLREYMPLLYIEDKLVLIPGVCVSREIPEGAFSNMAAISWELPDEWSAASMNEYRTDLQ